MGVTTSPTVIKQSAAIIRPRSRLKISEWADKEAMIPPEGNAEPGKFRLSRMPHQAEMLDDPMEPGVQETFWMMASQAAGKTLCLILICAFVISQLRKSLIMVRDTKDRALEWIRDKFLPTAEATPCMAGLLIDPRKRDSKSTSLSRRFPGGVFKIIGAKSRGAFRSTSAGVVLQDEIDAYETLKEGDPCSLADRATITFADAWKVKCSTPTIEDTSRIHAGFKRGDQRLYFLPCPCCGEFQALDFFKGLKFTFTAEEHARFESVLKDGTGMDVSIITMHCHPNDHTWQIGDLPIRDTRRAMIVCEFCHRGWTDQQRIASYMSGHTDNPAVVPISPKAESPKAEGGGTSNIEHRTSNIEPGLRAEWRATAPFKGVRSRHLSGMYLTIGLEKGFDNYLHQFAENFLKAKHGGRETLMAWWNMFLALCYEDPAERVEWEAIKKRADDYEPDKEIPAQVVWVAYGADVHPDRVEILFYGWGEAQEAWCLSHQVIFGDFDMPSCQERVWDYLANKKFKHPILGEIAWSAGGFDSGHQTKVKAVYQFCAKHRLSNVYSLKGFEELGGATYERKTEKVYGGVRLNLNTDYFKTILFDRLRNDKPGPRYVHFPKEHRGQFGDLFYGQLCSEKRIREKGSHRWVKQSSSTRNEVLDMTVYAFTIYEVCRQEEWIARKWKEVQLKLKALNPVAPVERREVFLNPPTEMKKPELQAATKPNPYRRKIRINSPFGRFR